jgi:sulfonate transport system ATP-binding protein
MVQEQLTLSLTSPQIQLDSVNIVYDQLTAVSEASFAVERGTFLTIVGPSGCGKSSLLLAVAGLIRPSKGRVLVDGKAVTGPGRDRAMVFQDFALMPWRTVIENVRFGLELQRWNGEDLTQRARRYVKLVGLSAFEEYHPHQLSGGMRQRVGIARALAVDPEILLLDEPFASLDAQTREEMGNELMSIWEQNKKTALFVTHSLDEAVFLGDRVIVMGKDPGRIIETMTIDLPRPRTPEIMDSPEYTAYRRRIRALLS